MSAEAFTFQLDDPAAPDVANLLARHHALMRSQSPPESCHVKTSDELSEAGAMTFSLRDGDQIVGIGAMVTIGPGHLELKSMHVPSEARGRGLGTVLLDSMIAHACKLGATQLSLETGSAPEFAAARALYRAADFAECPPFGDYIGDPLSTFMTRAL